ncbi:MAG: hypothetical protein JRM77_09255 [Nitrososphaerota archaeon]|nr:hypothetical protein [Nitrososphaerota archaeon]
MVGRRPAARNILLVTVVLGLLLIPWGRVSPVSASGNPVGEMVADIASWRPAQGSDCQAVISVVQGGGIVEQDLNQAFGTDFKPITVDSGECSVLLTFAPIVGAYNDLITAAVQYNNHPNDSASATNFYEKAFILSAEVMLVGFALDGTLYKASFQVTSELNDGLELGKLQSICGDACYADVLSAIYWFIKGTAVSALDGFLTWVFTNLPSSITDELPNISTNPSQIGAFGMDQTFPFAMAALTLVISFLILRRRTEAV